MSVNRISSTRRPVVRVVALASVFLLGAAACSEDPNDAATTSAASTVPAAATSTTLTPLPLGDIVATALTNHVFTELAGLVVDMDLVEALRGGPYTVFAPTDAAFDKLPLPVLHTVQDNPDVLKTVLLHHVVEGTITPEQLAAGELTTLAGTTLTVTKVGETFFVDGNPVGAGVEATNGYVYVMSDVLVPAVGTVVDVAVTFKDAGFGTLVDAVTAAELVDTLSGEGPFTVFAPVDAAFEALDPATLNAALNDPSGLLTTVLTYHVVPGKITTDQFTDGGKLTTVQGEDITTTLDENGGWLINGNPIAVQNIQASNGVIHAMGAVLLPPSLG
ncbi:MAG: fasciclin domain-containing protein [Actinobacteria bacterium]|nr:fasciclin domain-containing protein [Actinomycetota bacterium]